MRFTASRPRESRPEWLQAALIILAGIWAFSPAFRGEWLWDDNLYIIANPLMNDPAGLWKIWFQPGLLIDYYPITFTVQRLEWFLWGMDTLGYHLTNLALHLASAFLIWRLFSKLGLRFAWWGALIFAIHPIMVESVSWITELKNTLSLPPLLLAMGLLIDFEEKRRWQDYVPALLLFLVAMLCKTSVTMLPVVFLLYVWWKKGRIAWRDLLDSAPFFLVALLPGLLGLYLEHYHPGPPAYFTVDLLSRVDTAAMQVFFFFFLSLFPIHLVPIYPSGLITAPSVLDLLPWLLLIGLLYVCWHNRRTWGRHVLLGLCFFLLNLVPIILFIMAGLTTMVWSMDHLNYLPIIGLIGLVVGALDWAETALPQPAGRAVMGVAVAVTVLLALECYIYAAIFSDPLALWVDASQRNPQSWMVRVNLGEALGQRGRVNDGIEQFRIATKLNPIYDNAHYDLAKALAQVGRREEAIEEYQAALKVNPSYANAYYDLGNLLILENRIPEATEQFNQALQANPRHAAANYALGNILADQNHLPEAINHYEQSLLMDPTHPEVHNALGNLFLKTGQLPEAAGQFQATVLLDPHNEKAFGNLGVALARMRRFSDAQVVFSAAVQVDPNDFEARNNLGSIYMVTGKFPEAIEQYQAALRIKPDSADAQKNLARVQAMEQAHGAPAPSP